MLLCVIYKSILSILHPSSPDTSTVATPMFPPNPLLSPNSLMSLFHLSVLCVDPSSPRLAYIVIDWRNLTTDEAGFTGFADINMTLTAMTLISDGDR